MADQPNAPRREFFRQTFTNLGGHAARVVDRALETTGIAKKLTQPVQSVEQEPKLYRPANLHDREHFRPPGATHEAEFLDMCSRCRRCVDVCPEHCLFVAGDANSLTRVKLDDVTRTRALGVAAGTPVMFPNARACTLCGDCVDACPSGALLPTPREFVRIGLAAIKARTCIAFGEEHCTRCHDACPVTPNAVTFPGGYYGSSPEVDTDACTGCGQCVPVCPTSPKSIEVFPRPLALDIER
ncbi:MAG: 4Fe-4S dicluster domain-containing protein [Planctomycetaceae bacterium]|nr:4Fe-4S dicluster domain-containing protein [Planctomycetaceae bacterium]